MQQVIEALKKTDLPERQQRIFSLFPGLLFGFAPPYLNEMIERIDCPTCTEIVRIAMSAEQLERTAFARIADVIDPIRARNAQRQLDYEARKRWPFVGMFISMPKFEQEPDCELQPSIIEVRRRARQLIRSMEDHFPQDLAHWGSQEGIALGKALIKCHLMQEAWMFGP